MMEVPEDQMISLDEGFRTVHQDINLFFSNQFEAAYKDLNDKKFVSVLHSGGLCYYFCNTMLFTAEKVSMTIRDH